MSEHILTQINYLRDYADRLVQFSESLNRWERRCHKEGNRRTREDPDRAHQHALHAVRKRIEAGHLAKQGA